MERVVMDLDDLRNDLARHIATARGGAEVIVTDHHTPVARILGVESASGLRALVRAGIAKVPMASRRPLPERVSSVGSVSDLVAEQRR